MPRVSQAHRDARRQQILDAALVCFSRDGFHATTTADIVRESGVSQGTLYLYFANKDDIVVALADDRHHSDAMVTALAQREQDPVRGLHRLVELHGQGLAQPARGDMRRVGVQGWGEALRNDRIRDSVVAGLNDVRQALVKLLERGQRTGQVRASIDADAAARTLIATFQGFVLQAVWGEPLSLARCGGVMRAMICDGLLTDAGRASWANAALEADAHLANARQADARQANTGQADAGQADAGQADAGPADGARKAGTVERPSG